MIMTFLLFRMIPQVSQVPQATVRWGPQVLLASRVSPGSQALLGNLVQRDTMAAVIQETAGATK